MAIDRPHSFNIQGAGFRDCGLLTVIVGKPAPTITQIIQKRINQTLLQISNYHYPSLIYATIIYPEL
jgi:hypothetical protein